MVMDIAYSLFGLFLLQVVSAQFGQFGPPPPGLGTPFSPYGPVPAFDQDPTADKYQPGKCLTANVTSNLQDFARCVREIIDPVASSEGSRGHSFQEIYELLSFRLFGQPPQVSFEQPLECPRMEKTSDEQIYVRLVDINGEINRDRGRVQVSRDNNRWGSICDDSWDERDAEVVCKMMGHSYGSNRRNPIAIGGGASMPSPGPGPYGLSAYLCTMMDAVDCIGWESNLGQCGWINNSPSRCNHYEDAAVDCNPDQDYREFNTQLYREIRRECLVNQDTNRRVHEQRNVEVRLVNGKRKSNTVISGRVEVRASSGQYGSVCDDDFDDDDARVICRQLGSLSEDRRRKPRAFMMGAFGTMNPDECISMDDLHCTGNENNIGKCHHSGETGHNCQHSEDAAVDCNTFPYDVKLESITRTSDYVLGVLMVSNDDRETYGAITDCFDFPTWNRNATEVARKRLRDVPNDCTAVWVTDSCMEDFNRQNPPEPLMHQVVCNRTADDLGMCEFQPRLAAFTTCPSTLAVGLFCTSSGRSPPRTCQEVGSFGAPMTFDPFRNDTFGAPSPLNPFGPFAPPQFGDVNMFGGQFGAPMYPGFTQNQTGNAGNVRGASPFLGAMNPQPQPFLPQPPFQNSPTSFQPGGFGSNGLQLKLGGCPNEMLYGTCQAGVLLVGMPPQRPYGTVCKDGAFTTNSAEMSRLVCTMMNPRWTEGELVSPSMFGSMQAQTANMVIGLDELQCPMGARSLSDCSHNQWGSHNCDHSKDVALICGTSRSDIETQRRDLNRQGQPQGYNPFQYPPQYGFGNIQG